LPKFVATLKLTLKLWGPLSSPSHLNLQNQFRGLRVELDQVRVDLGRVVTRVEQESMRTLNVIRRVGVLLLLLLL